METFAHLLREQATAFVRRVLGRDQAQPQLLQQEQSALNGVVRQTLDPDQAAFQQRLTGPARVEDHLSLAQRTFDRQGQQTTPSPGAQQFLGQIDALRHRLAAQHQADQGRQQGGWGR